jgi:hypothetical protein
MNGAGRYIQSENAAIHNIQAVYSLLINLLSWQQLNYQAMVTFPEELEAEFPLALT